MLLLEGMCAATHTLLPRRLYKQQHNSQGIMVFVRGLFLILRIVSVITSYYILYMILYMILYDTACSIRDSI